MTTRHAGYVVTLEKDIREDDAQCIFDAIHMIRGVLSVKPVEGGIEQHIADERAQRAIRERLWKALEDK